MKRGSYMYRTRPCLAVLSLLLACGPDPSGGTDTDPLPGTSGDATGTAPAECPADLEPFASPDEYAEALAIAMCAKLESCGCTAVSPTCVADKTADNVGRNKVYLAAGSVFDPLCARKRVLQHEWTACGLDSASPCGGCQDFVGKRAEGDTCELIVDVVDPCGPELFCNGGVCTGPLPPLDEGEACREGEPPRTLGYCPADQFCDFDQDICVPVPEVGDPCRDYFCGSGAWCSTGDSATGVCRAQRSGGEPCTQPNQCQSLACVDNVCSEQPRYCIFAN
ncbi:hypothetical protein [Nannocystis sp. SCPEA4]|uniref:hypothetical protein n=1 Tax=Nannocystis sp. SCPEA4 TaxID=2996787 RepID=UPI0022722781|nr:hypothetical protein [Nannocystis sp. SCPEA4]MCY1054380.1 hypothetical protein [Nannocystis sp. SCPEA4]